MFDYVSATRNERAADNDWIKYLSKALKNEKDCPYDYSKIKIVAGEEVCTWNVADDFEYSDEFLAERGGAPLYTTDQGGAFEVAEKDGGKVLMQKITKDIKATEWGRTPKPVTCFGDDRWWNYSVSADVYLETSDTPEKNYAGIGMRYNLATAAESGYRLAIYENGKWEHTAVVTVKNGAISVGAAIAIKRRKKK